MLAPQVELGRRIQIDDRAVDAGAHVALAAQFLEHLHVLALAVLDYRREQQDRRALGQREDLVDHLADGLGRKIQAVVGAARRAGPRVQQTQVVIDLGDGADGGARIVRCRFLLDGDRRAQAIDAVDVRLFHHRQELACVRRQRFDVAALALGVDRVERQRRFSGAG